MPGDFNKNRYLGFFILLFFVLFNNCEKIEEAPFKGTIFLDPDIIADSDPSTFESLYYKGQGLRTMFDRRVDDWIKTDAYLFPAKYEDGLNIEIQVNPEFQNPEIAQIYAEKFAEAIGRLSTELRKNVETVWIHRGMQLFGGGNNNILIHTDYSEAHYEKQGILEEVLVHEASHTSLDKQHSKNGDWLLAQKKDKNFISEYAQKNPNREDIAESYLTYLAIRYRPERISDSLKTIIENTIPNRIKYFDNQSFNMNPIE